MFLGVSNDVSPLSLYTWSSVVSVLTVAKSNSVPKDWTIMYIADIPCVLAAYCHNITANLNTAW